MVAIEGNIRNSAGQPLIGLPVEAFQSNPLGGDLNLTSIPEVTDNDGYFKIIPQKNINETNSGVYIVVTDESKKFVSIRDRRSRYKRKEFFSVEGINGWKWRSETISNLNNVIEIIVIQDYIPVPSEYDSVVIGSGFGGTITSLAIANMYSETHSDPNNQLVNIPSFNVYPGTSQKQDIEILADGFENITITDIVFMPPPPPTPDGLSFKIHDPQDKSKEAQFPLELKRFLPAKKVFIPLTVSLAADKQEVNVDVTAKISATIDKTTTTTTTTNPIILNVPLHIGNKHVCILERGQWWISHEIPDSNPLRTFLVKNNMPFSTWAYPNDIKGMLAAIGNSRFINRVQGVYDFKQLKNVNIIAGSGVGGGSLVYFNITEKPEHVVYQDWPTEHDGNNTSLDEFYPLAEKFIGVNPIITTAGLGGPPLPKASVFQNAAKQIGGNKIMNLNDLNAKLSITDISTDVFNPASGHPNQGDVEKYTNPVERNVCERQGRCGLGCIPGARHTLNKQIFNAIDKLQLPIDIHPLCEVLEIEELAPGQGGYKYAVKFIDYRDIIDEADFLPARDLTEEERTRLTKVIKANRVILAAGTLGSTELLLKSKKLNLSDTLGKRFSTNGDLFGIINPTKYTVDASRGPTQTSIARFKADEDGSNSGEFAFSIEDVGIPQMFAEVFATLFDKMREQKGSMPSAPFIPNKSFMTLFNELVLNNININDAQIRNILARLIHDVNNISLFSGLASIYSTLLNIFSGKVNQTPEERVSNMLVLFGIGRDNNTTSKLILSNENRINLDNEYNLQQPSYDRELNAMKFFAQKIGKDGENSLIIPLWDIQSKRQISAHPIGGCSMGDDAASGVVDSLGRVFKGKNGKAVYDGLYVADGSIVPTSLGVNPSLTISALAYRVAFYIVDKNKDHLP